MIGVAFFKLSMVHDFPSLRLFSKLIFLGCVCSKMKISGRTKMRKPELVAVLEERLGLRAGSINKEF